MDMFLANLDASRLCNGKKDTITVRAYYSGEGANNNKSVLMYSKCDQRRIHRVFEFNTTAPFPSWISSNSVQTIHFSEIQCISMDIALCLARLVDETSPREIYIDRFSFKSEEYVKAFLSSIPRAKDLEWIGLRTQFDKVIRRTETTSDGRGVFGEDLCGVSFYRFHHHLAYAILQCAGRITTLCFESMDDGVPSDLSSFFSLLGEDRSAGIRTVRVQSYLEKGDVMSDGIALLFKHNPIETLAIDQWNLTTRSLEQIARYVTERKALRRLRIEYAYFKKPEDVANILHIIADSAVSDVDISGDITRPYGMEEVLFKAIAKNQNLEYVTTSLISIEPESVDALVGYLTGHASLKRLKIASPVDILNRPEVNRLQARINEYLRYLRSWKCDVLFVLATAQARALCRDPGGVTARGMPEIPTDVLRVIASYLPMD